ncbi:MAG: AhpC/TSA family protein [Bacteroidales bacterium]|nr:AhpC/TSA family protein [Bacteroidales bacterium]
MKRIWFIILTLFCIISCSRNRENVTIKGSFKEFHPEMIYLKELTRNGVVGVDSSEIDDRGEFMLHAGTTGPAFYVLWIPHSRGINLLALPDDHIKVYINSGEFDIDYTVEGSVESRRISKLVRRQHKTLNQITELSNRFEEIKNAPDYTRQKARLDSLYLEIVKQHKKFSEGFILENPASMVNLMVLDQQLGKTAPVFDIKKDFRIFEIVDSCLTALYPSSEIVINLNRKVVAVREELKTEPGSYAPDISLPDTTGNIIRLQSLKGKNVLLIFWASWCIDCMAQSKKLVNIYQKHDGNLFEIYQVSLDKTRESWVRGLKKEDYPWINVSDLKYWDSETAHTYMVRKIPLYFLIDPDGKIVIKTSRLTDIESKLDEIL